MGQYHMVVNLTKREFIHPHKLGSTQGNVCYRRRL